MPTPRKLLSVLLLALAFGIFACGMSEAQIKDAIQKAQACTTAEDCVDIGGRCPYGCFIPVNKQKADEIKTLVRSTPERCAYDCLPLKSIVCQDQRCTALTENNP